jgi:hypothetical protein
MGKNKDSPRKKEKTGGSEVELEDPERSVEEHNEDKELTENKAAAAELAAEQRRALASIDSHAKNKRAKKAAALLSKAEAEQKSQNKDVKKKKSRPCKYGRECSAATCRFDHPGDRCPRGSSCTRGSSCLLYHSHLDKVTKASIAEREAREAAAEVEGENEEEGGGELRSDVVAGAAAQKAVAIAQMRKKVQPTYRDLSLRQQSLTVTQDGSNTDPALAPDIRSLAETFGRVRKLSAPRGMYQLCKLQDKVKYVCTHTGRPCLSSILAFNIATGEVLSNAAFSQLVPAKVIQKSVDDKNAKMVADPGSEKKRSAASQGKKSPVKTARSVKVSKK